MNFADSELMVIPANTVIPSAVAPITGRWYVGDWSYVHIHLYTFGNGAAGALAYLRLAWYLDLPAVDLLLEEKLTVAVNTWPAAYYGYYCLPVRGPWLDLQLYNPLATVGLMKMAVRLSNVRAQGVTLPLINEAVPSAAAGVTSTYYSRNSVVGRLTISGYIFNSIAGGQGVLTVQEMDETGTWVTLNYQQTPVGAAANYVHIFAMDIPASGRSIRALFTRAGAGVMNGHVSVRSYADNG